MSVLTEENRKWWTLAAVAFTLFMIMLDTTVVNVALPAIRNSFSVDISELEWVVNAYTLAYAVLLLLGGKLADFLGRRLIFTTGLALFTVSSLACALAPNAGSLIAFRGAQGIGAAFMLPATLAIISATFEPHERGLAIGIWAGVSGLGLAIGPLVGGALVESINWRWIFYVNVPIGIIGVLGGRIIIRESRDPAPDRTFDVLGIVVSAVALFALTYAFIEANNKGWSSALIVSLFIVSAVGIAAFVAIELRARVPIMDVRLFASSTFAAANLLALVVFAMAVAVLFVLSLYLQVVRGYSALKTGVSFLPLTLMMLPVSPLSGKLSDRFGPRWPIAVGAALMGVMLLIFVTVDENSSYWLLAPGLAIGGTGFALSMAPNTAAVLRSVDETKAGLASGTLNTFRQIGGVLGIAVLGAILNRHIVGLVPGSPEFRSSYVTGMQDALLVGGIVMLVASVIAAVFIRQYRSAPSLHAAAQL